MTLDVENALIAALGGSDDPGVDPVGIQNRIESLSGDLRAVAESYIDRTINIPLPDARSLSEIGDTIRRKLADEMPELSELVRAKLANYYTYQWR